MKMIIRLLFVIFVFSCSKNEQLFKKDSIELNNSIYKIEGINYNIIKDHVLITAINKYNEPDYIVMEAIKDEKLVKQAQYQFLKKNKFYKLKLIPYSLTINWSNWLHYKMSAELRGIVDVSKNGKYAYNMIQDGYFISDVYYSKDLIFVNDVEDILLVNKKAIVKPEEIIKYKAALKKSSTEDKIFKKQIKKKFMYIGNFAQGAFRDRCWIALSDSSGYIYDLILDYTMVDSIDNIFFKSKYMLRKDKKYLLNLIKYNDKELSTLKPISYNIVFERKINNKKSLRLFNAFQQKKLNVPIFKSPNLECIYSKSDDQLFIFIKE